MLTNRSTLPVVAGLLFTIVGGLEVAHDQANPFTNSLDYLIEGFFVAALAVGAAALWQLRDAGARIPFSVAAAGHAVLLVPAAATFVRGQESLDPLFPLGVLAILIGILAAAVADARGRVAPRAAGLLLLAAWIVAIATDTTVGVGLAWRPAAPRRTRTRNITSCTRSRTQSSRSLACPTPSRAAASARRSRSSSAPATSP